MEKICKKCYKFFTPVTDGYLDQRYCSVKCKREKKEPVGVARKIREQREAKKKKPIVLSLPAITMPVKRRYTRKDGVQFDRSLWQSKYRKSPNQRYGHYRTGALSRGRSFDISFEDFMTFWGKPCFYCHQKIETIGLDRIDNSRGYSKDNLSPCCRTCNSMKYSMSRETFLRHCVIITAIHGQFKLPETILESNIDNNSTSSTLPDSTTAK